MACGSKTLTRIFWLESSRFPDRKRSFVRVCLRQCWINELNLTSATIFDICNRTRPWLTFNRIEFLLFTSRSLVHKWHSVSLTRHPKIPITIAEVFSSSTKDTKFTALIWCVCCRLINKQNPKSSHILRKTYDKSQQIVVPNISTNPLSHNLDCQSSWKAKHQRTIVSILLFQIY